MISGNHLAHATPLLAIADQIVTLAEGKVVAVEARQAGSGMGEGFPTLIPAV